MTVVAILGVVVTIAIPDVIAMRDRAKEGNVKSSMHAVHLAAEDYGVQDDGACAATCGEVLALLPGAGTTFQSPFDPSLGSGNAWIDQPTYDPGRPSTGSAKRRITACGDSSNVRYQAMDRGVCGDVALVTSGG